MEYFFTGCTHFGHESIIRLAERPFANAEHMDHEMIKRWNARVGKNDVVYHMGDVIWGYDLHRIDEVLRSLNGHIHLVHGNHDPGRVKEHPRFATSQAYRHQRFGKALPAFVMFHYPIEEWDGWWHGTWHVHAHTHKKRRWGAVGMDRRVNVTVEAWDYAPAPLDEVIRVWR